MKLRAPGINYADHLKLRCCMPDLKAQNEKQNQSVEKNLPILQEDSIHAVPTEIFQ